MPLESVFKSESFCFVFSLQSGAVMSILVIFALTITSILHIMYFLIISSSFVDHIVPFCIAYGYMIVLAVGLILAFIGAYTESTPWMQIASIFTGVAVVFYIVIAVMSFFPEMFNIVCFGTRCPDQLWLQQSYWRMYEYNRTTDEKPVHESSIEKTALLLQAIKDISIQRASFQDEAPINGTENEKSTKKKLGTDAKDMGEANNSKEEIVRGADINEPKEKAHLSPSLVDYTENEERSVDFFPNSTNEDSETRTEGTKSTGLYTYSLIMSCIYVLCYVGFLCYVLYGYLAFASELQRELYGYY